MMDKMINKILYTYKGILLSFKQYGILLHAIKYITLGNIMLSKISHIKMANIVWFHWYDISGIVKFIEAESRIVLIQSCGREVFILMGTLFEFKIVKNSFGNG